MWPLRLATSIKFLINVMIRFPLQLQHPPIPPKQCPMQSKSKDIRDKRPGMAVVTKELLTKTLTGEEDRGIWSLHIPLISTDNLGMYLSSHQPAPSEKSIESLQNYNNSQYYIFSPQETTEWPSLRFSPLYPGTDHCSVLWMAPTNALASLAS